MAEAEHSEFNLNKILATGQHHSTNWQMTSGYSESHVLGCWVRWMCARAAVCICLRLRNPACRRIRISKDILLILCFIKINCIKNLYFNLQPHVCSFCLKCSENMHTKHNSPTVIFHLREFATHCQWLNCPYVHIQHLKYFIYYKSIYKDMHAHPNRNKQIQTHTLYTYA